MDVVRSEPTGFQAPCNIMVVWFFERASRTIKVETRYDNDSGECLAITIDAGGRETFVRFSDADQFCSWLLTLETALVDKGWRPRESPIVMSAAQYDAMANARASHVAPEPIEHDAEGIGLRRRLRFLLNVFSFSGRRQHAHA